MMRTNALGTLTLALVGVIPYDRISGEYEGGLMQRITFRVGLAGKVAQIDVTATISPATAAPEIQEALRHLLAWDFGE